MQRIQKNISEFLTNRAVSKVQADVTVLEAVKTMSSDRSDCVLVMEDGNIIGIFTERDFLNRVISARLIPEETLISDVMTADPEQLRRTDCVSYAIERMANRGFRNIPIVDDNKPPVVLTVWDVMSHLSEVLAEVEQPDDEGVELEEWTDIGGG